MDSKVAEQVRAHTLSVLDGAPPAWGRMIDVSMYNGAIDWRRVANDAGLCAVSIKATEGARIVDPRFARNWSEAGAAGLRRAPYLFYRPSEDPTAQVDLFAKTVGKLDPRDLRPVVDLERATPELSAQLDNQHLQALINLLSDRYKAPPIIYTSRRYCLAEGITVGGECSLWDVDYVHGAGALLLPSQWTDWAIAQVGFAPGVPGIATDVDRDLVKVPIESLSIGGV
jgi:lysozyme